MSNLDELLKPISDDAPAGVDLRQQDGDATLDEIRELRTELDPVRDPEGHGREADWRGVARECEEALRTRSKDFELAAWLAVAWARTEGFSGLERGLALVSGLATDYWDTAHPGMDDDDGPLTKRGRWLGWVGGSDDFLRAVRETPIAQSGSQLLDWSTFLDAQRIDDPEMNRARRDELLADGALTVSDWTAALVSAPTSMVSTALEGIEACEGHIASLEATCKQRFEDDVPEDERENETPSFFRLSGLLDDVRGRVSKIAVGETAEVETEASEAGASEAGVSVADAGPARPAGPIQSREEALRRLSEVADFFRRTEPHSPLSPLISRAVRWGHMQFAEVLKDLAKDDDLLGKIWETLGIESEEDDR